MSHSPTVYFNGSYRFLYIPTLDFLCIITPDCLCIIKLHWLGIIAIDCLLITTVDCTSFISNLLGCKFLGYNCN
jgi:hypothetical protein